MLNSEKDAAKEGLVAEVSASVAIWVPSVPRPGPLLVAVFGSGGTFGAEEKALVTRDILVTGIGTLTYDLSLLVGLF